MNERHIIGKAKTKEEAQQKYTQAIQSGDHGFLVERENPNIFSTNVGNILPKVSS